MIFFSGHMESSQNCLTCAFSFRGLYADFVIFLETRDRKYYLIFLYVVRFFFYEPVLELCGLFFTERILRNVVWPLTCLLGTHTEVLIFILDLRVHNGIIRYFVLGWYDHLLGTPTIISSYCFFIIYSFFYTQGGPNKLFGFWIVWSFFSGAPAGAVTWNFLM